MIRSKDKTAGKSGFTLVEILVVVAVIGLLIGGIFKLMGLAGNMSKKAATVAKMQRIQNALAGYYAAYGTYPPVKTYGSSNPYLEETQKGGSIDYKQVSGLSAGNANAAAAAQPVEFLYPNAVVLDEYVVQYYKAKGMSVASVSKVLGDAEGEVSWNTYRLFKFGLLSYLVPRIDFVGANYLYDGSGSVEWSPVESFFRTKQWVDGNVAKYPRGGGSKVQLDQFKEKGKEERTYCAEWITQLEKLVTGQCYDVLGTVLSASGTSISFSLQTASSGTMYALQSSTLVDGWGNSFYYHSEPPYQSYRLWSAGPNGNTFPCWISYKAVEKQKGRRDAQLVQEWISDDIVGSNQ